MPYLYTNTTGPLSVLQKSAIAIGGRGLAPDSGRGAHLLPTSTPRSGAWFISGSMVPPEERAEKTAGSLPPVFRSGRFLSSRAVLARARAVDGATQPILLTPVAPVWNGPVQPVQAGTAYRNPLGSPVEHRLRLSATVAADPPGQSPTGLLPGLAVKIFWSSHHVLLGAISAVLPPGYTTVSCFRFSVNVQNPAWVCTTTFAGACDKSAARSRR